MLDISERARRHLEGVALCWLIVERTTRRGGQLPEAKRAMPSRDPETLKEDPVARAYRDLFWDWDIDPTKQRPAGEALARRVAREGQLPSIHPLVDAYNLASARTLVPLSAFDIAALDGDLILDVAGGKEVFEPIGGEPTTVDPGRAIVRDATGPVSLFLHRDGARTALGEATEHAVIVAGGPAALAPRILPEALRVLEAYLEVIGWRIQTGPEQLKL